VDARPSNRYLIDSAALASGRFRWLINTSRGMVIDSAALAPALVAGRLRGLALDVYDPEPPPPDSDYGRLLAAFPDRVILTPHMASRTHRALENMSWVVRDVVAVIEGGATRWPAP
jgi:phosphoglycerate dehydrogenase-like enzyme